MKQLKRCGLNGWMVATCGLGILIMIAGSGCSEVDCENRRCKVVEVALAEIYVAEVMCCRNEELDGCANLHNRSGALLRLIDLAYEACLERDWIRLQDIWGEIRQLKIIRNHVIPIISEVCGGLELLMGLNSMPLFSDTDMFSFECTLEQVESPDPILSIHPVQDIEVLRSQPRERYRSIYQVMPGSTLEVDTWAAHQRLMLEGHVSLEHEHPEGPSGGPSEDSTCRLNRIAEFRLDIHGEGISGRIEFGADGDAGHHVLDEFGRGMLMGVAQVSMEIEELPGIRFEEMFGERFWIEIPIRLDGDLLVMAPEGGVTGSDLFPVSPEVRMLFEEVRGVLSNRRMGLEGDDCQEAAMNYVEDLKEIFASCFPAFSTTAD